MIYEHAGNFSVYKYSREELESFVEDAEFVALGDGAQGQLASRIHDLRSLEPHL